MILVEGVMGLYDGMPGSADIARIFAILSLSRDSSAPAPRRPFGALAYGLQHYQNACHAPLLGGVLGNRSGDPGHARSLAEQLPQPQDFWALLPTKPIFFAWNAILSLTLPAELQDGMARLDKPMTR